MAGSNIIDELIELNSKLIREIHMQKKYEYIGLLPSITFPKVQRPQVVPVALIPLKTTNLSPGIITVAVINN